jgi:hypothetical protein
LWKFEITGHAKKKGISTTQCIKLDCNLRDILGCRKTMALFRSRAVKFWEVTSDVSWDVGWGVQILIKKLIIELACKL